jgi:NADH:ubiquinone oxidoreductase subunit 3 (subunit A)
VTSYQLFLLIVLIMWPVLIVAMLFLMSKLEDYVARSEAATPEEAGLEPVSGQPADKEVKIIFGDEVIGSKAE